MATLKKHGIELARLTYHETNGEMDKKYTTALAFFSDGNILKKEIVIYNDNSRKHTWGWKIFRKRKDKTKSMVDLAKEWESYLLKKSQIESVFLEVK